MFIEAKRDADAEADNAARAMTMEDFARLEPGLWTLWHNVLRDERKGDWYAYEEYKSWMKELVGFHSHHPDPRVRTTSAYDTCLAMIVDALEL